MNELDRHLKEVSGGLVPVKVVKGDLFFLVQIKSHVSLPDPLPGSVFRLSLNNP